MCVIDTSEIGSDVVGLSENGDVRVGKENSGLFKGFSFANTNHSIPPRSIEKIPIY